MKSERSRQQVTTNGNKIEGVENKIGARKLNNRRYVIMTVITILKILIVEKLSGTFNEISMKRESTHTQYTMRLKIAQSHSHSRSHLQTHANTHIQIHILVYINMQTLT